MPAVHYFDLYLLSFNIYSVFKVTVLVHGIDMCRNLAASNQIIKLFQILFIYYERPMESQNFIIILTCQKMEPRTKMKGPNQKSLSKNAFIRLAVLESKMRRKQAVIGLSADINNISNWEVEENQIQLFVQRVILFTRKTETSTLLAQCLHNFISLLAPFGIQYRVGILYQMTRIHKAINFTTLEQCLADNLSQMKPELENVETIGLQCLFQFCRLTQNQQDFQVVLLKCVQRLKKIVETLFQTVQISLQRLIQYQSGVQFLEEYGKTILLACKFCCLGLIKSMKKQTKKFYNEKLKKLIHHFFEKGKQNESILVEKIIRQVINKNNNNLQGTKMRQLSLGKQKCRFMRWKGYPDITPIEFKLSHQNKEKQNIFRLKKFHNVRDSNTLLEPNCHKTINMVKIKKERKLNVESRIYSLSLNQKIKVQSQKQGIPTKLLSSCPLPMGNKGKEIVLQLKIDEQHTEFQNMKTEDNNSFDQDCVRVKTELEENQQMNLQLLDDENKFEIVQFESNVNLPGMLVKEQHRAFESQPIYKEQDIAVDQATTIQQHISITQVPKEQMRLQQMESECWEMLTDHISDLVEQWMETEVQNVSEKYSLQLDRVLETTQIEDQPNELISQQYENNFDIYEVVSMSQPHSSKFHESPAININMVDSMKSDLLPCYEDTIEEVLEPCRSQLTEITEMRKVTQKLGYLMEVDLVRLKIVFYLKVSKDACKSEIVGKNANQSTVLKIPILPQQKLPYVLSRLKDPNNYQVYDENSHEILTATIEKQLSVHTVLIKEVWIELWTKHVKIQCQQIKKSIKATTFVKWHTDSTFNLLIMIMDVVKQFVGPQASKQKTKSAKDCTISRQKHSRKSENKTQIVGSIKLNNIESSLWPKLRDNVELIIGANVRLDLHGQVSAESSPLLTEVIELIG